MLSNGELGGGGIDDRDDGDDEVELERFVAPFVGEAGVKDSLDSSPSGIEDWAPAFWLWDNLAGFGAACRSCGPQQRW